MIVPAYQVLLFACNTFIVSFYRVLLGEAHCPSLLSREMEELECQNMRGNGRLRVLI